MKRNIIRSILFDTLFFASTLVACVVLLPTLLLPRSAFMHVAVFWTKIVYALELCVMNLRLELRGLEHLPMEGSYILAAKHQSSYETFKLHKIFGDPAIILKRELLKIPLWGWYLGKSDVIAIDRSTPEAARQSIAEGARRMIAQGRPIVIFPQGTRVSVDSTADEKPYKAGVARLQEDSGLPIIPMAVNSGMYWPKGGLFKSSGTVVFEFLEPIPPGTPKDQVMKTLQTRIEERSQVLMTEAREKNRASRSVLKNFMLALLAALIVASYSYAWFDIAARVQRAYINLSDELDENVVRDFTPPVVTGFPGKIHLHVAEESLQSPKGNIRITNIEAQSWPLPGMPVNIATGPITIRESGWGEDLAFDSLRARLRYFADTLTIDEGLLYFGDFTAHLTGTVNFAQKPFPAPDLVLTLQNHMPLINALVERQIIKPKEALIAGTVIASMMEDGKASVPLVQKNGNLFLGPVMILNLGAPAADPAASSRVRLVPEPVDPGTSVPAPESLPVPSP